MTHRLQVREVGSADGITAADSSGRSPRGVAERPQAGPLGKTLRDVNHQVCHVAKERITLLTKMRLR